jgi:hypothetical protein
MNASKTFCVGRTEAFKLPSLSRKWKIYLETAEDAPDPSVRTCQKTERSDRATATHPLETADGEMSQDEVERNNFNNDRSYSRLHSTRNRRWQSPSNWVIPRIFGCAWACGRLRLRSSPRSRWYALLL